jgi:PPK2 family polyphosphate:nucleotide phosphotransferase
MKSLGFGRYRVKPGLRVSLDGIEAKETLAFRGGKREAEDAIGRLNRKLDELQELLYAEHRHQVLVVLQGMDTSGKDGTIRHVFEGVNPQGVKVSSFKKPTPLELDHDFLWRIHQCLPAKGEIVIFNRSHYEDVLAVRVHNLVPRPVWESRYESINNFEKMLYHEGVTILKFFLHISREEQKKRLQERLDDTKKHWKFSAADLAERKLWSDYRKAYEAILSRTSTDYAPWYILPSDKKWYRNLAVATILVEALEALDMKYPKGDVDPDAIVDDAEAAAPSRMDL